MMNRSICPNCGQESQVPPHYLGKQIKCTACQEDFIATNAPSPIAGPLSQPTEKGAFWKVDRDSKGKVVVLLVVIATVLILSFQKDSPPEIGTAHEVQTSDKSESNRPTKPNTSERQKRRGSLREAVRKSRIPFSPLGVWNISGSPIIKKIEIQKSGEHHSVGFILSDGSKSVKTARLRDFEGILYLRWDDPHGDYIFFTKEGGDLVLADRVGIVATGSK